MLNIFFGDMKDVIFNTSVYFKNVYRDEWITAPLSVEMIAEVDKSKVIAGGVIDSPVLGKIPPTGLIENRPDKVFNATNCGDNCAKWLLKIAEKKDVTINLRYMMDFGKGIFDIRVLNNDRVVHCMEELVAAAIQYV